MYYNSSDSGKIESKDDDSHFEPTDGAGDYNNNDDDDDDDDEGCKINSFASANSMILTLTTMALPEERRRGAAEELRRSA